MGDSILSTSLLNTIKRSFPDSEVHYVLNENLCPLFRDHPSIDRLIPFSNEERHNARAYINKVRSIMRENHYDVIIDMRSTLNTMLFSLCSRQTPWRIGLKKSYSALAFNYRIPVCRDDENMIDHNIAFLQPLEAIGPIKADRSFTLNITTAELDAYRNYLIHSGLQIDQPILLAGVTAKLAEKAWDEDRMAAVLTNLMTAYPQLQVVFNYAPGAEETKARHLYERLGRCPQIFIDVRARSMRELVALAHYSTFYFGNEGGARHIVQSQGRPSFVVCSPKAKKAVWLPQNDVPAEGIAPEDLGELTDLSYQAQYDLVTKEIVWQRLQDFIKRHQIL